MTTLLVEEYSADGTASREVGGVDSPKAPTGTFQVTLNGGRMNNTGLHLMRFWGHLGSHRAGSLILVGKLARDRRNLD